MTLGRFLWGMVSGAVAFGLLNMTYEGVSRCWVGTRAQEAADVAAHLPTVLEALNRAQMRAPSDYPLPDVALDRITADVVYAWSFLQRCAAERGLDNCRRIGAERPVELWPGNVNGEPFRMKDVGSVYAVPPEAPGPEFRMWFSLEGPREWTEVGMVFRGDVEITMELDWRSCVPHRADSGVIRSNVNEVRR